MVLFLYFSVAIDLLWTRNNLLTHLNYAYNNSVIYYVSNHNYIQFNKRHSKIVEAYRMFSG